jgi:hypothetical protein
MDCMITPTGEDHERRRERLSRVGTVEGYVAFVVLLIGLVAPLLLPTIPSPYGEGLEITMSALAWVLSLSGVRIGNGGGRVAAGFTLALLSLHAVTLLVIAYH